jgi:CRISPR-associated protein Cmr2
MAELFWQAKIWGLLHNPALKALHDNTGRQGSSFWRDLTVMQDWKSRGWDPNVHIQERVQAIKYISPNRSDHLSQRSWRDQQLRLSCR